MPAEIDPQRAFGLVSPSDFRGTPPPSLGADLSATPPAPGELIGGRFRLVRFLARGGMGSVFVGEDPELGRQVAVKFMLQSTRAEARERFLREAEVTARIRDPHVIQIHEAGSQGGHDYLVYELITGGKSLKDAFPVLGLEERLDLIEQIAQGLGAAHAHGIVHRDLKPENVLIRENGKAVVADFGLAGLDESSLTNTGQTLGTPAYMSPEQVRGERPTPACDSWALGLLLYEAIFQEHPLAEEGLSLPFLLAKIYAANIEVPPCPTPGLRKLLRRSLTADVAKRPADGDAFKAALVAARADSTSGARLPALALGLVLTLVLGALALYSVRQEAPGASLAVAESPGETRERSSTSSPRAQPRPPSEILNLVSGELPQPDFAFSAAAKHFEQLHFLSEEEVLLVSSAGIAQRWGTTGEPTPVEEPWDLPAPFRVYSALQGKTLLISSRLEGWVLQLPSHEPQKLPDFKFVPSRLVLFGSPRERYLLAANGTKAVWGKVGATPLELDLRGVKVRQIAREGSRVALAGRRNILGSRLYLLDSNTASTHESPLPGNPSALALSPTGERILVGDKLGGLSLRDDRGRLTSEIGGYCESSVRSVAWSRDRLAAVSKLALSVWDARDPSQPLLWGQLPEGGKGDEVYLSPSGQLVIVRRNAHYLGWRLPQR